MKFGSSRSGNKNGNYSISLQINSRENMVTNFTSIIYASSYNNNKIASFIQDAFQHDPKT